MFIINNVRAYTRDVHFVVHFLHCYIRGGIF